MQDIKNVDPRDPTDVVDEYLEDWWNHERDWKTHPPKADHQAAYEWHIQKVNEISYFILALTVVPIGSMVTINIRVN
jgi:hypothetical protein